MDCGHDSTVGEFWGAGVYFFYIFSIFFLYIFMHVLVFFAWGDGPCGSSCGRLHESVRVASAADQHVAAQQHQQRKRSDEQLLDGELQLLDLVLQLAALVGGDAGRDDGARDAAGAAQSSLGCDEDVGHVLQQGRGRVSGGPGGGCASAAWRADSA